MTNTFIPWAGGEQPVPDLTHVHIHLRNPIYNEDDPFYSQELDWSHAVDPDDAESDIVEYQVAEFQPRFQIWNGGENPVPGKVVEFIMRDSRHIYTILSDDLEWIHRSTDADSDIVSYRVVL